MNRRIVMLSISGVVALALCGGVGTLLYKAWSEKRVAEEERNAKMSEVDQIFKSKVFPSKQNVDQVVKNTEKITEWRTVASNLLHQGEIQIDPLSASAFKQQLVSDIRLLSSQFRLPVAQGRDPQHQQRFGFSFERYIGGEMPNQNKVPRLNKQWSMIKLICDEIKKAGVSDLLLITRERFDEVVESSNPEEEEQNETHSRRRRRRSRSEDNTAQQKVVEGPKIYKSKERFEFTFLARPDTLVKAVNRISSMDIFAVVDQVEIHKQGNQLQEYMKKKADAAARSAEEAASKKEESPLSVAAEEQKPARRAVVTDPVLDSPSKVKLVVDVYTF